MQRACAEKCAWAFALMQDARMHHARIHSAEYILQRTPCMRTCTHTHLLSHTLSTTHNGTVNPEGACCLHGETAVGNTLLQWKPAVRNTCDAIMLRAAGGDALHADDAKLVEDGCYVGRGQ
jgi:hypothetical protein